MDREEEQANNNKAESDLTSDDEKDHLNGNVVKDECIKDKIFHQFIEEVYKRHSFLSLNKSLLQKLATLISKSSDKVYVQELNDSEEDNEQTFRKLLGNIAIIQDKYHDALNKNLTSLNTLKEEIRLKKEALMELKALFRQTKEKVALSSVNSETGERFALKDVKELLAREDDVSRTLEEYQLHSIEKRHNLNLAIEKKKNLAEGPIDFAKYEMMCTETQNNREIIQPISEEIKNIMNKTSSIINILSHLGQKLYQVQKEQTKVSNTEEELEKELSEMRNHMFEEKMKFTKMKHENKELQDKFVLLQHPRLIESYNSMQQENEETHKEVEKLKAIYAEEIKIVKKDF